MQLYRQASPGGWEITGFGRPMGLGVDAAGRLLVADMDCHRLVRLDAAFHAYQIHTGAIQGWSEWFALRQGSTSVRAKSAPGRFNGPHAVEEDGKGNLLVTCYYTPEIAVLAPDGSARRLAGQTMLKGPATTRVDKAGRLLVAEYALNLVLVLDESGACTGRLGYDPASGPLSLAPGSQGVRACAFAGGFDRPHMALGATDGSLLVADTWNHRLQRFAPDGRHDACLNDYEGWRSGGGAPAAPPALSCPVALDIDAAGRLLVTCWGSGTVLLLGPDGRPQSMGRLPALSKPYDARFLREGIVVADTHNGRILVVDNV